MTHRRHRPNQNPAVHSAVLSFVRSRRRWVVKRREFIGIHPFVIGTPDGAAALRRVLTRFEMDDRGLADRHRVHSQGGRSEITAISRRRRADDLGVTGCIFDRPWRVVALARLSDIVPLRLRSWPLAAIVCAMGFTVFSAGHGVTCEVVFTRLRTGLRHAGSAGPSLCDGHRV